jgi:hypothetical protein
MIVGASQRSGALRGHVHGSMHLFRSLDGGRSWLPPTIGPFMDWTATAVAPSRTGGASTVYIFGHDIVRRPGEWTGPAKPVRISRDGGRTFSPPHFGRGRLRQEGGYPVAARGLPDGSAVALYAGPRLRYRIANDEANGSAPNDVVRRTSTSPQDSVWVTSWRPMLVDPVGRIRLGAEIPEVEGINPRSRPLTNVGMDVLAHDRSGSPEIAVVYPALRGNSPVLILAISDRRGGSWRQREVQRFVQDSGEGAMGPVGIAANRAGQLAITWHEAHSGCQYIIISADQGASFTSPQQLSCRPIADGTSRARFPSTAANLQTMGVFEPDAPEGQPVGLAASGKGLSIRLTEATLTEAQLVADASGRFHPLWTELADDGRYVLTTARVAPWSSPPTPDGPSLWRTITDSVLVDVVAQSYDGRRGWFVLDFTLTNLSRRPMQGPFAIRLGTMQAGFGFSPPQLIRDDGSAADTGAVVILDGERRAPIGYGQATAVHRVVLRALPSESLERVWQAARARDIHPVSIKFDVLVGAGAPP